MESPVLHTQSNRTDDGAIADLRSSFDLDLQRRATRLCRCAEPHTSDTPCAGHVREALRQLPA